jgi:membrane AbrB-like protein
VFIPLRLETDTLPISPKTLRPIAVAFALSLCGGVFSLLRISLPWMLGPLFFVGLAGINSVRVSDVRGGPRTGQLIIGCGLGLYFTPEVSRQLLDFGGYIILAAVLCILAGVSSSRAPQRVSGIDSTTAFFASLPSGAADMAILSERAGARFDQVTPSHSLRILLAVSTVPIAVTMTGASGGSAYEPLTGTVVPTGLVQLFAVVGADGWPRENPGGKSNPVQKTEDRGRKTVIFAGAKRPVTELSSVLRLPSSEPPRSTTFPGVTHEQAQDPRRR